MILSAQTIRRYSAEGRALISPLEKRSVDVAGNSKGLGPCGCDLTLADDFGLLLPGDFVLAAAAEYFNVPHDIFVRIHDKSSLARLGIAIQNTVAEPGWRGYLTLEISYHNRLGEPFMLRRGLAIAQVTFERLDQPTDRPYSGKYQDQGKEPQPALPEFVARQGW